MRIGIDIDDTITNTWNDIIPYFSHEFDIPEDKLRKSMPYYEAVKEKVTKEEYFERIKPIYNNVSPTVSIKNNVSKVLTDLHDKGHTIIFITSRGDGYTDASELTKEYLLKNNIPYDKLIVGAGHRKANTCLYENIDLYIDDSYKHLVSVSNLGIKVLMVETYYNKEHLEFPHLKDWLDIYKYIEDR